MKKFDPSIYTTECCEDTIFSKYEGQFSGCKCGKTFIDETAYYGRSGGNLNYVCKQSELKYLQVGYSPAIESFIAFLKAYKAKLEA
jgi:hypothetical protein